MIILAAYAALAAGIVLAALAVAAQGSPLPPQRYIPAPIPIVAAGGASEPIRCLPSPIWCETSRRWRDPVTKRYAKRS